MNRMRQDYEDRVLAEELTQEGSLHNSYRLVLKTKVKYTKCIVFNSLALNYFSKSKCAPVLKCFLWNQLHDIHEKKVRRWANFESQCCKSKMSHWIITQSVLYSALDTLQLILCYFCCTLLQCKNKAIQIMNLKSVCRGWGRVYVGTTVNVCPSQCLHHIISTQYLRSNSFWLDVTVEFISCKKAHVHTEAKRTCTEQHETNKHKQVHRDTRKLLERENHKSVLVTNVLH